MVDTVRVLRVIQYIGPRNVVEDHLKKTLQGSKIITTPSGTLVITGATLDQFPEILNNTGLMETKKEG